MEQVCRGVHGPCCLDIYCLGVPLLENAGVGLSWHSTAFVVHHGAAAHCLGALVGRCLLDSVSHPLAHTWSKEGQGRRKCAFTRQPGGRMCKELVEGWQQQGGYVFFDMHTLFDMGRVPLNVQQVNAPHGLHFGGKLGCWCHSSHHATSQRALRVYDSRCVVLLV